MSKMAVMDELRNRTRVRITAKDLDLSAVGRIEDISVVDDLTDLDGVAVPREVFRRWGVTRLAVISCRMESGEEMLFTALEIDAEWYDLQSQKLTLEVIGQYEWPQLPRT